MARSPAVRLHLVTDFTDDSEFDCSPSMIQFRRDAIDNDISRPHTGYSDRSYYTAYTTNNDVPTEMTPKITAKISAPPIKTWPSLRHKRSPTKISLRELRAKHSSQCLVRTKQSDERLQQLYESQILSYLQSPDIDFGGIGD